MFFFLIRIKKLLQLQCWDSWRKFVQLGDNFNFDNFPIGAAHWLCRDPAQIITHSDKIPQERPIM